MSDTFDHALDACEEQYQMDEMSGWECGECGVWHPDYHESCWRCEPSIKEPPCYGEEGR